MPERSKRHHFLPQLILRGFDRDGQVGTFDREQQKAFRQSIERAAAENDYNTLLLEDGSLSDTAETLIGSLIEGPAGKVLAPSPTEGGSRRRRNVCPSRGLSASSS
jgi:hypothetical protein